MKSTVSIAVLAALACVMTAGQAAAGTRGPGVSARQQNQRARIQQGVRSGELTRRETRHVAEDQRDIRQLERGYKSDGKLTGAERHDLQHEQNQASRDIYKQKHDSQDRPAAATTPGVRDPGVNTRQGNQTARIQEGVKSGELTHPEAQELRGERRDINGLEQAYKSDGTLSKDERQTLHQELNQQSKEIYAEKHDDQTGR